MNKEDEYIELLDAAYSCNTEEEVRALKPRIDKLSKQHKRDLMGSLMMRFPNLDLSGG